MHKFFWSVLVVLTKVRLCQQWTCWHHVNLYVATLTWLGLILTMRNISVNSKYWLIYAQLSPVCEGSVDCTPSLELWLTYFCPHLTQGGVMVGRGSNTSIFSHDLGNQLCRYSENNLDLIRSRVYFCNLSEKVLCCKAAILYTWRPLDCEPWGGPYLTLLTGITVPTH